MPEPKKKRKYLRFLIQHEVEVEPRMELRIDEILDLMQEYGSGEIKDVQVVEHE